MALIGTKNNKDIYNNLLGKLIPNDISLYIEPFGGEFGLYEIMSIKPPIAIYNDINPDLYYEISNKYKNNSSIHCFNEDYKKIIYEFDNINTFWYIDCPYLNNEHYYKNHTFLTIENHIELFDILKNIKGKFLLSYQDRPLMRELYNEYNFYKYTGTNYILKPEIAITNYIC
jgi:DNA adenine methylase